MFREFACAAVLLAAVTMTACAPGNDASAPEQSTGTASTTTSKKAAADQSETFFPSTVEFYGLDHTDTDREHLRELHALRQIDPCGLVDEEALTAEGRGDFSYTPTPLHTIYPDVGSPVQPLGGNGCTIAFPYTPVGLSLEVLPGEPTGIDTEFRASGSGVEKNDALCIFRVRLPLMELAGAPSSMDDPRIQIAAENIAEGGFVHRDPNMCGLAEAVAASVARQVGEHGVPTYATESSEAARFLTADPCAAATNLDAVGVTWREPNPMSQFPTTWRHPSVCNLKLDGGTASAVVTYGVTAWSDDLAQSNSQKPDRTERDGVALTSFGSNSAQHCFVLAKSNNTLTPAAVGSGAPELSAPTPVVTVQLTVPNGQTCIDTAQDTALAALKRAS